MIKKLKATGHLNIRGITCTGKKNVWINYLCCIPEHYIETLIAIKFCGKVICIQKNIKFDENDTKFHTIIGKGKGLVRIKQTWASNFVFSFKYNPTFWVGKKIHEGITVVYSNGENNG